jgi:hypothetical protein
VHTIMGMDKKAATWLGGPWDGKRVLVDSEVEEYAVVLDHSGDQVDYPRAQLYVHDPAYWLKERRSVSVVKVYPVTWSDVYGARIRWHERNFRIIEVGSKR